MAYNFSVPCHFGKWKRLKETNSHRIQFLDLLQKQMKKAGLCYKISEHCEKRGGRSALQVMVSNSLVLFGLARFLIKGKISVKIHSQPSN